MAQQALNVADKQTLDDIKRILTEDNSVAYMPANAVKSIQKITYNGGSGNANTTITVDINRINKTKAIVLYENDSFSNVGGFFAKTVELKNDKLLFRPSGYNNVLSPTNITILELYATTGSLDPISYINETWGTNIDGIEDIVNVDSNRAILKNNSDLRKHISGIPLFMQRIIASTYVTNHKVTATGYDSNTKYTQPAILLSASSISTSINVSSNTYAYPYAGDVYEVELGNNVYFKAYKKCASRITTYKTRAGVLYNDVNGSNVTAFTNSYYLQCEPNGYSDTIASPKNSDCTYNIFDGSTTKYTVSTTDISGTYYTGSLAGTAPYDLQRNWYVMYGDGVYMNNNGTVSNGSATINNFVNSISVIPANRAYNIANSAGTYQDANAYPYTSATASFTYVPL